MAGRKVMKTFSLDYEVEEKLKKIPSRQSFLVNALLKYFFEECEKRGLDWQGEIFKNPEGFVKRILKNVNLSEEKHKFMERKNVKADVESFW